LPFIHNAILTGHGGKYAKLIMTHYIRRKIPMITVISRFRVANQKSAEVELAFRERPRLVEKAPGFHGMEVLRDTSDASIFYLYTKWENLTSYQKWHSGPEHVKSHVRIPKGLKLDASFTKVEILHDENPADHEALDTFLEGFLSGSRQIYRLHLSQEGTIQSCPPMFADALGVPVGALTGKNISKFLVESDAQAFPQRLKSGQSDKDFILNFVGRNLSPFSLRARLFIRDNSSVLIAERDIAEESDLSSELISLNNEFARLTRENQQKNHELTKAQDELTRAIEERDRSYWFVRKVQEVLPICMKCHKVKTSSTSWDSLEDFFQKNTDFLSHGYCPQCLKKLKAKNQ
jgi:heme-degrading monooxygenase HmoA